MKKVGDLDVISEMSKRNMPEIKAATDITEMRKVKGNQTKVTFGVPFDCIGAICSGQNVCNVCTYRQRKIL